MAEASVTLPPTRRVAAKTASAVRDWVTLPSAGFFDVSIIKSLGKYCLICGKWNPRSALRDCRLVTQ